MHCIWKSFHSQPHQHAQPLANRQHQEEDYGETYCHGHLTLCSQTRGPHKYHDKTCYQHSKDNKSDDARDERSTTKAWRLPQPSFTGGLSIANADDICAVFAHAENLTNPMDRAILSMLNARPTNGIAKGSGYRAEDEFDFQSRKIILSCFCDMI